MEKSIKNTKFLFFRDTEKCIFIKDINNISDHSYNDNYTIPFRYNQRYITYLKNQLNKDDEYYNKYVKYYKENLNQYITQESYQTLNINQLRDFMIMFELDLEHIHQELMDTTSKIHDLHSILNENNLLDQYNNYITLNREQLTQINHENYLYNTTLLYHHKINILDSLITNYKKFLICYSVLVKKKYFI